MNNTSTSASNHSIIGTAGHVDHGKTSLIRALTGIETDRLKEEKKRGITIELGFAYLNLPTGGRAGIIDVPGHEKFIRNMLSGAGTIDVALLVISADEGLMPQTREHLDILSLLGISRGVIALTKADLVDKEWLEMVADDIKDELKKNYPFLADAPIMPVSAVSGLGISELKNCLFDLLSAAPQKELYIPFRMPVDRVFTADGFGTVVTGTLIEGELSVGTDVTVFPSGKTAKVRSLQNHTEKVQTIYAGQRAAVNLSGVSHSEMQKGDCLAAANSMANYTKLDVRLDVLKSTKRKLKNGSRLHLHHGTHDLLCKLILAEKTSLKAGDSAYAQLQLYEPICAKPLDRFVVRFYSPVETVGGGVILDLWDKRSRRSIYSAECTEGLKTKDTGNLQERIAQLIFDRSDLFPLLNDIKFRFFKNNPLFDAAVSKLAKNKTILKIDTHQGERAVHAKYAESVGIKCQKILDDYHTKNPLSTGMPKAELWQPLLPNVDSALTDKMLIILENEKLIKSTDGRICHPDFSAVKQEKHSAISGAIIKLLQDAAYATPSYDEVADLHAKDKKKFKDAFDALVAEGLVIMLTPQIIIHRDFYQKALSVFKNLAQKKSVTLAEFRDTLATSRKYAIAILEDFDLKRITKKIGDVRELLS